MNGHLKFACELLRKKCTDSLILIPNVAAAITTTTSTPIMGSNMTVGQSSGFISSQISNSATSSSLSNGFNNLSRDEKICKIASELLLCDEDSLRK